MIKEKNIFESTLTGKIYDSLKTALEAEKSEQTDSSMLINKFREVTHEFREKLNNINMRYTELKHETAELHRKYDPVLNSMAEALNSMGVDVSTLNSTDDERSGSPISKSHPKVRIAKVHASSFRKI
ncbi:MAG: hypothetical protein NC235_04010 [Clostridiales bacterium]|nr:hypothetical protein [Clostridiales bacterium]